MWLPNVDFYHDRSEQPHVRPSRPLCQGDVFVDVPLSIVKRHKPDVADKDKSTTNRILVALISHPCAMYANGAPINNVPVAEVRRAEDACKEGRPFEPPFDDYSYFAPLPALQSGEDYVVDFRRIGVTHTRYLIDRRIACLSHKGWAAFQRRFAYHFLRMDVEFDKLLNATNPLWSEFEIWEEWGSRGHHPPEYQRWLEDPMQMGAYAGEKRRDVLEYAPDLVAAELPVTGVG